MVLTNLISALKTDVFVSNVFKHRKKLYTQTGSGQHTSPADVDKSEQRIKQRWGEGKVLSDEREPGDESYLPLGRSPSSFLQRTVGTGSPRASHLNSTL